MKIKINIKQVFLLVMVSTALKKNHPSRCNYSGSLKKCRSQNGDGVAEGLPGVRRKPLVEFSLGFCVLVAWGEGMETPMVMPGAAQG